jgi:hypothetical protein
MKASTASTRTRLSPRSNRAHPSGNTGFPRSLIRAEVGDTINVVRNNARFKASLTRTACSTTRTRRARYKDGTSADKLDDGCCRAKRTRTWQVPERAARRARRQFGAVDVSLAHRRDSRQASGLVGPMIVTRKGSARADGPRPTWIASSSRLHEVDETRAVLKTT